MPRHSLSAGLLTSAGAFLSAAGASGALLPAKVLNALTSRKGYTVRADVPYGDRGRQRLDVYLPDGAAPEAPIVFFFHGGSWAQGDKATYLFVGQSFAAAGIIAVVPNYRLYPEVVFPDFVLDGARAVAWGRQHLPGGAERPLFLAGHSSGAHIAALLALNPRYADEAGVPAAAIRGTIGLSGPYDFLPLTEPRYEAIFPAATRPASQPIRCVDGRAAPMLLLTGAADRSVSPGNSARLGAEIARQGGAALVKTYAGVGHLGTLSALATALPTRKPPVRNDILAFIAAHS